MMKNILEIMIVTYNRSFFLERTLEQLSQSPFAACRITILDNCSVDATRAVGLKAAEIFEDLHVVTHRVNIGGSANYLRAVEISKSNYTWVLCDDDNLDFSVADDLMESLCGQNFGLLVVGSTASSPWEMGFSSTTKEVIRRGYLYYLGLSFYPAVIFRTSLFDADCFFEAYNLVRSWYPHFALLNKALSIDAPIYFAKHPLVVRNDVNESTFSPLSWYASWVSSCSFIADPKLRYEAISQATRLRGYYKSLAFWIAIEKHHDQSRFWEKIATIFVGYSHRQRPLLLLFLPLMLVPLPFTLLVRARDLVYRLMRVPSEEIPPVVINDRN